MRSELRNILREFKAEIVKSLSEGAVGILLCELEIYFVEEDLQRIKCSLSNKGHSWAADGLIDTLKSSDDAAFTKFLEYLSTNRSTRRLYNKISEKCAQQDVWFILPSQSVRVRSQKESATALMKEIYPEIANNLTQQDLLHLLEDFREDLKNEDIQRIKSDLESNEKDRAISRMVNCLLQMGKRPVMKLIKYLSENKKSLFKDIRKKFDEYDLQELLPAAKDVDEPVLPGPIQEICKSPPGHELEKSEELPIPETIEGKSVENNGDLPKENTPAMERYKMSSEPRGVCLIINNEDFSQTREGGKKGSTDREGSNVDEENLSKLFSWLKFTVQKKRNITALEMWKKFTELSKEDHSKYDCLVVCILSHGLKVKNRDEIMGVDGKTVSVDSFLSLFHGRENNSLSGKPKLFFLQCCRGKVEDKGVVSKGVVQHDGPSPEYNGSETIPVASDIFIGYSTPPGFKSWRNTTEGSWYIATLCKVFSECAKDHDLMTMAAKINKIVSEYSTDDNKYQIPNPTMTLRKLLFFNPN